MKSLFRNKRGGTGGKFNRKIATFLICLAAAAFFWLLSALSKEYVAHVDIPIKYLNLPKGKLISNKLPDYLTGLVKGKGFKLIRYRISGFNDTLSFDVSSSLHNRNKEVGFVLPVTLLDKFSSQLGADLKLLRLHPDSIFFNFSTKATKKVPVKLNVEIDFEDEYRLAEKIKFFPESVMVSGSNDWTEKIQFVETEKLKLEKVNSSLKTSASIVITKELKNLNLSVDKVDVDVNVDRFTERTLQLPLEVINLPQGITLKTFPDKVSIKFIVALGEFEKINSTMFKVVVDAADVLQVKNSKLSIQLVKSPAEVKNVVLSPEKVEFIIKK